MDVISGKRPVGFRCPSDRFTGIGTPHLGSPIADLVDSPEQLSSFAGLAFGLVKDRLARVLDPLGISLDGLRNLTTSVLSESE